MVARLARHLQRQRRPSKSPIQPRPSLQRSQRQLSSLHLHRHRPAPPARHPLPLHQSVLLLQRHHRQPQHQSQFLSQSQSRLTMDPQSTTTTGCGTRPTGSRRSRPLRLLHSPRRPAWSQPPAQLKCLLDSQAASASEGCIYWGFFSQLRHASGVAIAAVLLEVRLQVQGLGGLHMSMTWIGRAFYRGDDSANNASRAQRIYIYINDCT